MLNHFSFSLEWVKISSAAKTFSQKTVLDPAGVPFQRWSTAKKTLMWLCSPLLARL